MENGNIKNGLVSQSAFGEKNWRGKTKEKLKEYKVEYITGTIARHERFSTEYCQLIIDFTSQHKNVLFIYGSTEEIKYFFIENIPPKIKEKFICRIRWPNGL